MKAGLGRRTFLLTSAGTSLTAVSSSAWAAEQPQPRAVGRPTPSDPYEEAVRDARMEWSTLPEDRRRAPFLGNGRLGARLHAAPGGRGLRLLLGAPGGRPAVAEGRLDLVTLGAPTGFVCELNLWDAELTGRLTTTRGSLAFTALIPRHSTALVVRWTAEGGERITPCVPRAGERVSTTGSTTVDWEQNGSGATQVLAAAPHGTAHDAGHDDANEASALRRLLARDLDGAVARHHAWWQDYYRRSYVFVPDRTLQRFHWIQMYVAAVVTDPEPGGLGRAPSLLGPANHLGIGPVAATLAGGLPPHHDHLAAALPGVGSKAGRAPHPVQASGALTLWDAYRYGGDERVLRDLLHPALRRTVDFYANFLAEGMDGRLHLPVTHSPGQGDVSDCTYDLAMLRWAVTELIATTRRFGLDEPRLARWQDIAARLTPYHCDAKGVLVGAGVRSARSSAEPSHLQWILPLRMSVWSRPEDRELMRSSFEQWAGMRDAWDGESYAAAASMAAALRDPARAREFLGHLTDTADATDGMLWGNTLYRHCGDGEPLRAAASLAAGQALLDLLIGGDDTVEIFPTLPAEWRDVRVAGLRAPGALVVDAERQAGRTDRVRVRSAAERPATALTLRHGIDGAVDIRVGGPGEKGTGRPAAARSTGPGTVVLRLAPGETVTVVRRGADPAFAERGVPATGTGRRWGGTTTPADA